MTQTIKQQMLEARTLITSQRYQDAYDLLITINHPKAQEWIDKIQPKLDMSSAKPKIDKGLPDLKPWNPQHFFVFYIFGIVGMIASFILSLNWKRLGRPEWVVPSLLITVGIPITFIILIVSLITSGVMAGTQTLSGVSVWVVIGLMLAMYIFPFSLPFLQSSAYKTWKEKGNRALLEHDYRLQRMVVIDLAIFVIALVGGGLYYTYMSTSVDYTSDFIHVEYQRIWQVENTADFEYCSYDGIKCELILGESGRYSGTFISFEKITLDYPMTADDIADEDVAFYSTLPNFEYGGRNTTTINGYDTLRNYLNYDSEGTIAQIDFIIVRGDYVLKISAWAGCGGCLREDMGKIMQVINTIEFVD